MVDYWRAPTARVPATVPVLPARARARVPPTATAPVRRRTTTLTTAAPAVHRVVPVDELEMEDFVSERADAEQRLTGLTVAYRAEMDKRANVHRPGEVPPYDNYTGNKHLWSNAEAGQHVYNNHDGYLPHAAGPFVEKYCGLGGASQHGRMIYPATIVNGIQKWYTWGGTHPPLIPGGAFWAAWDGNRWWRWVGPTHAGGGGGLGVKTEYTGYAETPWGKLTHRETQLLRASFPFAHIQSKDVPAPLQP